MREGGGGCRFHTYLPDCLRDLKANQIQFNMPFLALSQFFFDKVEQ